MEDGIIGEKEKNQILLAKYSILRAEVSARVSRNYELLSIGAAASIWLVQQPLGMTVVYECAFALAGIGFPLALLVRDIRNGLHRIDDVEVKINAYANEKLLDWQTDLWGLGRGPLRGWLFRHVFKPH